MYIQQLYTNCLAQAAYYIESDGVAAIIDPMRDYDVYIELLRKRGAKLLYIFETHFHADFVSGHIDLAKATGAKIVFGPGASPSYEAYIAQDHEMFRLGKCQIEILHTPGHTLESICCLLKNEQGIPHAVFSGDTLFIGDVGRPDLLSGNLSADVLASMLYMSINEKIIPLDDDIIVYPGHGAGSACGRNLSSESQSTIGEQKRSNYALQKTTKEAFIEAVTKDQPPPPSYFFKDAAINKKGYAPLKEVIAKEMKSLSPDELYHHYTAGVQILDVRNAEEFAKLHIYGSINIGMNGSYAVWVGTLIPIEVKLAIVCNKGSEQDAIIRLSRVGYENIVGYYNQPIEDLPSESITLSEIKTIDVEAFPKYIKSHDSLVLDVRTPSEHEKGKVQGALHIPLNILLSRASELPRDKTIVVYCAGGYRSMIAASLLEREGFEVVNVNGGMSKIEKFLLEVVEYIF